MDGGGVAGPDSRPQCFPDSLNYVRAKCDQNSMASESIANPVYGVFWREEKEGEKGGRRREKGGREGKGVW